MNLTKENWRKIEKALKAPLKYKWRIKSYSKDGKKAQCLAYIDARDVQDRLDEVVGFQNWQDTFKKVDDDRLGIECTLTVLGVTKTDVGYPNNPITKGYASDEPLKDAYSDSLKRAAVKFGIGRFLYDLKAVWVDVHNKRPVDKNGETIWDLSKYINENL